LRIRDGVTDIGSVVEGAISRQAGSDDTGDALISDSHGVKSDVATLLKAIRTDIDLL